MSLEALKEAVADKPDKSFVCVKAGDVLTVCNGHIMADQKVKDLQRGSENAALGRPADEVDVYVYCRDVKHLIAAAGG